MVDRMMKDFAYDDVINKGTAQTIDKTTDKTAEDKKAQQNLDFYNSLVINAKEVTEVQAPRNKASKLKEKLLLYGYKNEDFIVKGNKLQKVTGSGETRYPIESIDLNTASNEEIENYLSLEKEVKEKKKLTSKI